MNDKAVQEEGARPGVAWRTNLLLFLATVASVFVTGVLSDKAASRAAETATGLGKYVAPFTAREAVVHGGQFAGALLTILLAHEFGHYIAARIHKVEASLPYFIPMPLLSPFGTMGAVIRMQGTIPTRRALLDIGAAGPLAGMAVAIPMYVWGVSHSHAAVLESADSIQLGESILLRLLDRIAAPPVADGMELFLSPIAFAAWGGMFVTMINMLPVAQLDGGHVAYALFGSRQDRHSLYVHRAMLVFFFVVVLGHVARDVSAGLWFYRLGRHVGNGMFWLVWYNVLVILGTLSSRGRNEPPTGALSVRARAAVTLGLLTLASLGRETTPIAVMIGFFGGLALLIGLDVKSGILRRHALLDHPPTSATPLDRTRAIVAILTLVMFVLLFMPEPIAM